MIVILMHRLTTFAESVGIADQSWFVDAFSSSHLSPYRRGEMNVAIVPEALDAARSEGRGSIGAFAVSPGSAKFEAAPFHRWANHRSSCG